MSDTSTSAKPTPGPWRVNPMTPSTIITPDGRISVAWSDTTKDGTSYEKAEIACRLIVAAVNSYARHTADSLAAAEADLLGKLLGSFADLLQEFSRLAGKLRVADDYAKEEARGSASPTVWEIQNARLREQVGRIFVILARAKGEPA